MGLGKKHVSAKSIFWRSLVALVVVGFFTAQIGVLPAAAFQAESFAPDPPMPRRDNSLSFTHFSLDQGLSQSVGEALLQDRQGFLWIGTQDGLNRFDGYTFKIFRHDPENPDSLSDNNVSDLVQDSSGAIWIGTSNGLNRYDPQSGIFTHFKNDPGDNSSLVLTASTLCWSMGRTTCGSARWAAD